MDLITFLDVFLNQKFIFFTNDYNCFNSFKIFKENYKCINKSTKFAIIEDNYAIFYKILTNKSKLIT